MYIHLHVHVHEAMYITEYIRPSHTCTTQYTNTLHLQVHVLIKDQRALC